jgi:hypothetical protein
MCKNVEIFNDFVETFFKSWQFPFQKSLNLQPKKKPPNFWKSENLHQKKMAGPHS